MVRDMIRDNMPGYKTATAKAFVAHWFALPREGPIPTLAAFLDRPVPSFQPRVALAEIISDTDVRYRLVGTELVDGFGERTGHNILEIAAPALRPELVAIFRRVVSEPCGYRALIEALTNQKREITFETVLFPLSRPAAPPVIVGCNETLRELQRDEALVRFERAVESNWIELAGS